MTPVYLKPCKELEEIVIISSEDGLALQSSIHPPSTAWKTRITWAPLFVNKIYDWFYIRLHRPKLSEDVMEYKLKEAQQMLNKVRSLDDWDEVIEPK